MAGHSHWARIRHKKAVVDARRGKAWGKLSRLITVAAKHGGGSPDDNPRLRLAIDKAKAANMPKDTIEKAVKKGTGELEGESFESVVYEGYAPGGVAVMCQALTDNRHRTSGEIRNTFERNGGNLGSTNCVSFMFKQKGVLVVGAENTSEDRVLEVALEAGADDATSSPDVHEIVCRPDRFEAVRKALADAGMDIHSADLSMVADTQVTLNLETARKVMRLVEAMEDSDDVEAVYTNSDIPDEVVAQLAKE